MFRAESLQTELSLDVLDLARPSFDLHKQPERQHVDHDLSLTERPRLPPLLVNERGRETERFQYRRHRIRICNFSLFLALLLDRRRTRNPLLVRQCRITSYASQPQHTRTATQPLTTVKRILFKLLALQTRADFRQTPQDGISLPLRESKFFLNLDHAWPISIMTVWPTATLPESTRACRTSTYQRDTHATRST